MVLLIPSAVKFLVVPGADTDFVTQATRADTGAPIDFTGVGAFYCGAKEFETDDAILAELTVSVSNVDDQDNPVTPADGWLRFELPKAEAEKFQAPRKDSGPADVFYVDAGGKLRAIGRLEWYRPHKRITDLP